MTDNRITPQRLMDRVIKKPNQIPEVQESFLGFVYIYQNVLEESKRQAKKILDHCLSIVMDRESYIDDEDLDYKAIKNFNQYTQVLKTVINWQEDDFNKIFTLCEIFGLTTNEGSNGQFIFFSDAMKMDCIDKLKYFQIITDELFFFLEEYENHLCKLRMKHLFDRVKGRYELN